MTASAKNFVINTHALKYILVLFLFLLLMNATLKHNGDVTEKNFTHQNFNLSDFMRKVVCKNCTKKTKTTQYVKKLRDSFYCEVTSIGCLSSSTKPLNKSDILLIKFLSLMTKQQCFQQCSSSYLPLYVGLTNGDTCMCTLTIDDPFRLLKEDQCSANCTGNKAETCGGNNAIEWFSLQTPCVKGEELFTKPNEKFRLMRCLSDDTKYTLMTSKSVIK